MKSEFAFRETNEQLHTIGSVTSMLENLKRFVLFLVCLGALEIAPASAESNLVVTAWTPNLGSISTKSERYLPSWGLREIYLNFIPKVADIFDEEDTLSFKLVYQPVVHAGTMQYHRTLKPMESDCSRRTPWIDVTLTDNDSVDIIVYWNIRRLFEDQLLLGDDTDLLVLTPDLQTISHPLLGEYSRLYTGHPRPTDAVEDIPADLHWWFAKSHRSNDPDGNASGLFAFQSRLERVVLNDYINLYLAVVRTCLANAMQNADLNARTLLREHVTSR